MPAAASIRAPEEAARAADLRYVHEDEPGIRRRRRGKGFSYHNPDGSAIRDDVIISRIRSLAIPPAYADVWICVDEDGHLQATGRDARGRKQYRYHARWHEARHATRFGKLADFAASLTALREKLDTDLSLPGMPRLKVIAAVTRLLEMTHIRVGNAEYARDNKSYGLTTLLNRHATIEGSTIAFKFRGKSGIRHTIRVADRRLARIVRRCQELPGQELFQYAGADGEYHRVTSCDVNAYLKAATGHDFTAKDFRTWAGTLLATAALREAGAFTSQTEAKRLVNEAISKVAANLGNTRAVCRKHYIHPVVVTTFLGGEGEKLPTEEAALIEFLRKHADS